MFVLKGGGDGAKCVIGYPHVCGACTHICHAYLLAYASTVSGRVYRNLTSLVAFGKGDGNCFSLYTFCTF